MNPFDDIIYRRIFKNKNVDFEFQDSRYDIEPEPFTRSFFHFRCTIKN